MDRQYQLELSRLNDTFFNKIGSFQMPIDPRMTATTVVPNKCKYMSSKKIPLWLEFQNPDPEGDPVKVIFKSGDDLRQDILTLQLLRIMNKVCFVAILVEFRLRGWRREE